MVSHIFRSAHALTFMVMRVLRLCELWIKLENIQERKYNNTHVSFGLAFLTKFAGAKNVEGKPSLVR